MSDSVKPTGSDANQRTSGVDYLWAASAAFCTYFCMYAFRKPFTAGTYTDFSFNGIEFKTLLVIAQVLGYTLAKFIGIKVISEISSSRRSVAIAILIGAAELMLLLFAVVPHAWKVVPLFGNGLALGMVFGLVLGYLEGRQMTEALAAGLCASFIVASGVVRAVGRMLVVDFQISEYWMPVLTGLIFAPPLFVSIWMLTRIPPPTEADIEHRRERTPLSRVDRWSYFSRYALGLTLLLGIYVTLTVLRSIRDDFSLELWIGLGESGKPLVFAQTETLVMFIVVALNASAIWVKRNETAFAISLATVGFGFVLVGAASMLQVGGHLSPFAFMVLSGVGLYLPYIAFHTTVFERLIACTSQKANLGFLMYLADSTGYLGYVGVMLTRTFSSFDERLDMLAFYHQLAFTVSLGSLIAVFCAGNYFTKRLSNRNPTQASSDSMAEGQM
jgi:hypothetical protein